MKTYGNATSQTSDDEWTTTLKVDEIRQGLAAPQPPFSDSYLSGGTLQQRKVKSIPQLFTHLQSKRTPMNPKDMFSTHLREAIVKALGDQGNLTSLVNTLDCRYSNCLST